LYFGGASGFWHHGMGVFLAAKTEEGHTVQYYQAPFRAANDKLAIIAAVAVKMGDDVITFTPIPGTSYAQRQVMRIRVNGEDAPYGVAKSMKAGYVTAASRNSWGAGGSQPICIGDHKATFTVSMEADSNTAHEINWKIMMNDGAIDRAVQSTCELGPASFNTTKGNKDRVAVKDILFSAKELQEMCSAGWAGYGSVCNFDMKVCPTSNKALCDSMGSGYHGRAVTACSSLDAKFKDFCVFQYCNDLGKGDYKRQAMMHQGDANARQNEVMASHN
jgi:hypothetical protein